MLCGPAITVRVRPGDNLMIHVAMQMAQPGDVIVVDGAGAPVGILHIHDLLRAGVA